MSLTSQQRQILYQVYFSKSDELKRWPLVLVLIILILITGAGISYYHINRKNNNQNNHNIQLNNPTPRVASSLYDSQNFPYGESSMKNNISEVENQSTLSPIDRNKSNFWIQSQNTSKTLYSNVTERSDTSNHTEKLDNESTLISSTKLIGSKLITNGMLIINGIRILITNNLTIEDSARANDSINEESTSGTPTSTTNNPLFYQTED